MKTIAFYLPQFAPNKYNDKWWGKGFTEWSFVAQGKPLFEGHYQPHIPADLGFYDLRLKATIKEQQDLARQFGVGGFCIYHYWFDGERILDEPLELIYDNKDLDFPYCICWANETWSKTWDGINSNSDILLNYDKNKYSPLEHIKWMGKFLNDQRYITIDDKPLIYVWRPDNFNDTSDILNTWRTYVKEEFGKEIYIVAADHIGTQESNSNLISLGYDAVYDFKPNFQEMKPIETYECKIPTVSTFSYEEVVANDIKKEYKEKVFPTIFPAWDNTVRKTFKAFIIQNSDAEIYRLWLEESCKKVEKYSEEEQIVMINAWNEWGEGCHLEPDVENGRIFLEATKQVMQKYIEIEQNNEEYKKIEKRDYIYSGETYEDLNFTIEKGRKIFIWGTGAASDNIAKVLFENDVEVCGYVDNSKDKWDTLNGRVKIFNPEYLRDLDEKPFIIIASMFFNEISKQLDKLGYIEKKDYKYLDTSYLLVNKENEYCFMHKSFKNYSGTLKSK